MLLYLKTKSGKVKVSLELLGPNGKEKTGPYKNNWTCFYTTDDGMIHVEDGPEKKIRDIFNKTLKKLLKAGFRITKTVTTKDDEKYKIKRNE